MPGSLVGVLDVDAPEQPMPSTTGPSTTGAAGTTSRRSRWRRGRRAWRLARRRSGLPRAFQRSLASELALRRAKQARRP